MTTFIIPYMLPFIVLEKLSETTVYLVCLAVICVKILFKLHGY